MKLSQLSLADYSQLDSIPVINQDLSASGFTPVANTYYRHTGATTATFTQGVIYLYDTAYHKLGESGGGMTLNKYETTFNNITGNSTLVSHLNRIVNNAKGRLQLNDNLNYTYIIDWLSEDYMRIKRIKLVDPELTIQTMDLSSSDGNLINNYSVVIKDTATTFKRVTSLSGTLKLIYFNDTEIT